jgi:hypothetical protein
MSETEFQTHTKLQTQNVRRIKKREDALKFGQDSRIVTSPARCMYFASVFVHTALCSFPLIRKEKQQEQINQKQLNKQKALQFTICIETSRNAIAYLVEDYSTSRKVAGSIPDEVIGFFN